MFEPYRKRINEKEGVTFPSKTYEEMVLAPAYEEAKRNFLQPMLQIHTAHLKMLEEQGLIDKKDAVKIGKALHSLDIESLRTDRYDARFEDLFFRVEHCLLESVGDIAGNLHIARSRNDMGIAIYRMTIRRKLLDLMQEMITFQEALLALAKAHVHTIFLGYTHTQQAQPTTLAHYLKAVSDQLGRDIKRLQAAYETVNRSSMGAAALTTSGFSVSRERMQQLLGFEEVIENAWDAVSSADYMTESASAVQLSALHLGRTVQDFLTWATKEFDVFTLADPYVQVSSIMPQKRNPVSIEHMRALLSAVVGDANTVLTMVHNTPFGDIVDTEDDMQPFLWRAIERLGGLYRLFGSVLLTMEVHEEKLAKRAVESFANVTELADTLVRIEKITFKQAHQIVSNCVKAVVAAGEESLTELIWSLANEQANALLKRDLTITEEQFNTALRPEHFVAVRNIYGGPATKTMKRSIANTEKSVEQSRQWVGDKMTRIADAEAALEKVQEEWGKWDDTSSDLGD